jgi:multidrug efflux pump subunit AcrA (membrane-fusion protein)
LEEQPQNGQLSHAGWLRVLALVVSAVAVILVVVPVIRDRFPTGPAAALPRMVQGSFRPDSDQWKNIMMGTVTSREFIGVVSTPSTLALDNDTDGQNFSPIRGNIEKLWLVGKVREEDASQLKLGQAIDVTIAALPGQRFRAKLTWVSSAIDPSTHRSAVRAEIANPSGVLKPAMFGTMAIAVGSDRVSPAVPEIAVLYEGNQARVWAYAGNEKLVLRTIKLGRQQDGFIEVLNGLAPGDRVVLSGSLFLYNSARAD